MTPFEFIHVYPGVSVAELFAALTDPAHQAAQDKANEIERRDIIERFDDATRYRGESRIFPRRQLPGIVKPLVRGGLEIHEVVTWDKATNALEYVMLPAIFGGRSKILAKAELVAEGANVRRDYRGSVSVEVTLIGGRVEKSIVAEMNASLDRAHRTTLAFLGRAA